jgi:hypothetical protein
MLLQNAQQSLHTGITRRKNSLVRALNPFLPNRMLTVRPTGTRPRPAHSQRVTTPRAAITPKHNVRRHVHLRSGARTRGKAGV